MPSGKQFFDELIDHWKAMPRGDGPVPSKTTFSPMRLYKMLPYLYFSERLGLHNIRLRLMGDELEEATRTMVPNRNVFDAFAEKDWDRVEQYYDTFCGFPCAGHMIRTITYNSGLVYDLETLGLPLADLEGKPRFIVGLAQMVQNRTKSVEVDRTGEAINEITKIDYWDLGYGIPAADHQLVAHHAGTAG